MLKTRSRAPLGRGLSYPVNLTDLETALGRIPQADALEVRFSPQFAQGASEFRATINRDLPQVIVDGRFSKWEKGPSRSHSDETESYLKGVWSLTIYPVASVRRKVARDLLRQTGLPALAAWFQQQRPPTWYHGRKRCAVMFDPAEGSLRVEEKVETI